jgi:hypothetical protein
MLAILGVIFLIFIIKFIYDNFLSDNASKTSEWYKQNYPEESYRLDNNQGLNMNVKPKNSYADKQLSLITIAKNMGTTTDRAKEVFIENLSHEVSTHEEKRVFLSEIKNKKIEEAYLKNIDPDDGVAAIMEIWAIEYFSSNGFKSKIDESEALKRNQKAKIIIDNASRNTLAEYPELQRLVNAGDKAKLTEYLKQNPDAFHAWMKHFKP